MNARVNLPVLLTGKAACQTCKGACCKRYPGSTLPSQWGDGDEPDWDRVEQALLSGEWVIDWWDSYPDPNNRYYIRPATTGSRVFDGNMWAGTKPCTFLTDEGCRLSESERPAECLSLSPQIHVFDDIGELHREVYPEDAARGETVSKITQECFHTDPKADGRSIISKTWLPHSEMLEFVGHMVEHELEQRADERASTLTP